MIDNFLFDTNIIATGGLNVNHYRRNPITGETLVSVVRLYV